jgi:hypothetical protein
MKIHFIADMMPERGLSLKETKVRTACNGIRSLFKSTHHPTEVTCKRCLESGWLKSEVTRRVLLRLDKSK